MYLGNPKKQFWTKNAENNPVESYMVSHIECDRSSKIPYRKQISSEFKFFYFADGNIAKFKLGLLLYF